VDCGELRLDRCLRASGKSTLFYLLGGLTQATSGRVIIDGDDFARLSDAQRTEMRKRKIAFVFQNSPVAHVDCAGNIEIAHDIAGKNGKIDDAFLKKVTGLLGIEDRLDHRPSELSGGRSSGWHWRDAGEPAKHHPGRRATGNLDTKNSEVVLSMLRQSNKEFGQTVLMITHNPEAARYRRPRDPHARWTDVSADEAQNTNSETTSQAR